MKQLDLDRKTLLFLYYEKKLSAVDIAKKYKCGTTTIYRLMNQFNIKRRTESEVKLGDKKKPDRETLEKFYITKKYSTTRIGKLFEVHNKTVGNWLRLYNIPIRNLSESQLRLKLTHSELHELYVVQNKSTSEIADMFKLDNPERVRNCLKYHKISRRSMRSIMLKRWKDAVYREKVIKNTLKSMLKRPTSLEKKFIGFIEKHNLPFRYTGNGAFLIGYKNPDFVCTNNAKICIEVANEYHHPPPYAKKRVEHFAKWGWKCLIFFQNDRKREFKLPEEEMLHQIQQLLGKSI